MTPDSLPSTLTAALAAVLLTVTAPALQDSTQAEPLDVLVDDDPQRRYLLHGLTEDAQAPKEGWRLLVVLPGGNGSAEFAPFVGRIRENALGEEWLIAQIVAPKWESAQECGIVWPMQRLPCPDMKLGCEELFETVVEDVAERCELDPRYLFTLAWSSSGSLAYTLGLDEESRVTGSFIAMSVYKPDLLPSLKPAKGRAFYILHSPDDRTCPVAMAEQARDELDEAGALVRYTTYAGGHGWHGDVFGMLRGGVEWLEGKAKKSKSPRKRAK
jgi:predicted esterase